VLCIIAKAGSNHANPFLTCARIMRQQSGFNFSFF